MVADRAELLGVVTQPDRPAGRGQRLTATPVKAAAIERALPVYEPRNLRQFTSEVRALDFDVFVVASYGRILPSELIALPELGALNVHPSLLPRYRGATPIQAALLAGDGETGVTLMLMDEGMDTGDVVVRERVAIGEDETYGELHDRLARIGARLLGEALARAECEGAFPRAPQSGEIIVTRPIAKGDLELDWRWTAQRIVNHVRAYSPQPAARAMLANTPVKILRAHVSSGSEEFVIPCGDGAVAVDSLIAPDHRPESGVEFARRMKLV